MTLSEARSFALSLPEAVEEPHFEYSSFRVPAGSAGRKIFATVPPEGTHLHIFLDEHAARAVVAETASACEELWWGRRLLGVRVDLAQADRGLVCELLEAAWRRRAPKRVLAEYERRQ